MPAKGSHDDEAYYTRNATRAAKGEAAFAFDADIKTGKRAAGVHEKMNPFGIKVRESRDSDLYPESTAVAVFQDVTGSMRDNPRTFQQEIPKLMGMIIRTGALPTPHMLVGAVGDYYSDTTPFQVGQFEGDIKIDDDITSLYLEGGGGGSNEESYDLALYFLARKTSIDCWEKRGKKGYAFIIGDEKTYQYVDKEAVKKVFGDTIQANIPINEIVAEVQQRWNLFFIMPNQTAHWTDTNVQRCWTRLIDQNFLRLEGPKGISALIAATVLRCEQDLTADDLEANVVAAGFSATSARSVSTALAKVGGENKGAVATVPSSDAPSGLATL